MVVTLDLLSVDPSRLLVGVDSIGLSGGVGPVGVSVGVEPAGLSVGVGICGLLLLGCPKLLMLVVFPVLCVMLGEGDEMIGVVVTTGVVVGGSGELA